MLGAPPMGLQETFAQQRALLRERRNRLDSVIEAIEQAEDALAANGGDWDHIVTVIRAFQMDQHSNDWAKQYFSDEQLARMSELSERSYSESARAKLAARTWTAEDQRGNRRAVQRALRGGAHGWWPRARTGSPEAQELAAKAIALIEVFTGSDPEVRGPAEQLVEGLCEPARGPAPLPDPAHGRGSRVPGAGEGDLPAASRLAAVARLATIPATGRRRWKATTPPSR